MIIEDSFPQRSEQWYQAKAGVAGSSSFDKIVTSRGEPSKQAREYIYQLIGEKLLGRIEESYTSFAMQTGIDREDEARQLYELVTGQEVRQVAMVFKNENRSVACSPDGLLNGKGLEVKCPLLKTHVKYLLDNQDLVSNYFHQVQGSLWICGFDTWDLMSYVPGIIPLIITVERDEKFIAKLEVEMVKFLKELDRVYKELMEKV